MQTQNRDLQTLDRSRTGLLQLLIIIIMAVLAVILFLAYQQRSGMAIPALAIVALLACLYVLARERKLRQLQRELTFRLIARERQMHRMGETIEAERGRSAELGSRLDEITPLYRAIAVVNAVQDPAQSYAAVVEAALELVGADCGSLMVPDPAGSRLRIRAAQGLSERIIGTTSQPAEEGVAGWVFQRREALLLDGSAASDERIENPVHRNGAPIRSALSVPVEFHGEVVGVLNLGLTESAEKDQLTDRDRSLAAIFAQHAGAVVRCSQLSGN